MRLPIPQNLQTIRRIEMKRTARFSLLAALISIVILGAGKTFFGYGRTGGGPPVTPRASQGRVAAVDISTAGTLMIDSVQ
jgi:hypothetical protein